MRYEVQKLFLILVLLLMGVDARAWPPTYGTEFNFTNQEIDQGWQNRVRKWGSSGQRPNHVEHAPSQVLAKHIKKICDGCKVESHVGKWGAEYKEYKVTFPSGFGFNISTDPACVEIQTFASSSKSIEGQMVEMQKFIFQAAKDVGLVADGNAHLNIGLRSAFEDSPESFARMLADYSNRPELALGVLGEDTYNAPLMEHLSMSQQKRFADLMGKVNSGEIKTLNKISDYMNYSVYTRSPDHGWFMAGSKGRHYQAVGLKQIIKDDFRNKDMPFEFRAITQQTDADEYKVLTQFMDRYIGHIKKQTGPMYFRPRSSQSKFTVTEKAAGFLMLTREMDDDWKKYRSILPQELVTALETGKAAEIVEGRALFNLSMDQESFHKMITDRVHVSPWIRGQLKKLMMSKQLPEGSLESILKHLMKQTKESAQHSIQIRNFMLELSNEEFLMQKQIFRTHFETLGKEIEKGTPEGGCAWKRVLLNLFTNGGHANAH